MGNTKKVLLLMMLASYSAAGLADINYVCKQGENVRKIAVVYGSSVEKLPCRVVYEKDNQSKTLWRANFQLGYCEGKAEAFVEKQRGWGWACDKLPQQ